MPWTLADYRSKVTALASSQSPVSADINGWVNECRLKLQPYARLEKSGSVNLVAGTAGYTPPTDLYEFVYVYRQDDLTRDPLEVEPLDDYDRTGVGYRHFADQIIVQPTPTSSDAGKKLYIDYYKLVGKTSDSGELSADADVFNLPAEFLDIPFLWACVRAKQQDDEFGEGRDFKLEYETRLAEFKASRTKKRTRKGKVVRIVKEWI